ncbi:urease accessory protein UreD [uncultured Pseudokineococcus sp.]|uniref:urease accessory protein UreD n=1 Tax=uncultured Pseudokineococcus sp. TaxID=1642928 RepID=UPI002627EA20|nr:urease accessory protein UreD [uncultured Pseudokineococcus sp.]
MSAGTTRVALRRDGSLDLSVGAFSPKVLHRGPQTARVALVGTRALLLAGDHVDVHVEVEDGCALELVEVAATVAYNGRGGPAARWDVHLGLGAGALLVWEAQPLVVADGADVDRDLHADLDGGALLALRETIVLGRTGESGGRLRARTTAEMDGVPLLVEDLDLRETSLRSSPAVLGSSRQLETVAVLGRRVEHPDALQLEGPGTLVRSLVPGGTSACWAAVRADLLTAPRGTDTLPPT